LSHLSYFDYVFLCLRLFHPFPFLYEVAGTDGERDEEMAVGVLRRSSFLYEGARNDGERDEVNAIGLVLEYVIGLVPVTLIFSFQRMLGFLVRFRIRV
jgi:hypothetical protein